MLKFTLRSTVPCFLYVVQLYLHSIIHKYLWVILALHVEMLHNCNSINILCYIYASEVISNSFLNFKLTASYHYICRRPVNTLSIDNGKPLVIYQMK